MFGQDFRGSLVSWILSDGLGLLILTPFFLALLRGDYLRCFADKNWQQRMEAVGLQVLAASIAYGCSSSPCGRCSSCCSDR